MKEKIVGFGTDSNSKRHYITGAESGVLTNRIRVQSPGKEDLFVVEISVPGLKKKRYLKTDKEAPFGLNEEVKVVQITTIYGKEEEQTYYIRSKEFSYPEKPFFSKTKLVNPFK